LKGGLIAWLYQ